MDNADNDLSRTILKFWLAFALISMLVLLLVVIFLFSQIKKGEGEDGSRHTFDESVSVQIEENQDLFTGYVVHPLYNSFSAAEPSFVFNNFSRIVSVSDYAVYGIGYYSINGSAWKSFSLAGTLYESGSSWLTGVSTATLPSFGVGEHYVIVYGCTYFDSNSSWDCHGNKWQLIVVNNTAVSPGGSDVVIYAAGIEGAGAYPTMELSINNMVVSSWIVGGNANVPNYGIYNYTHTGVITDQTLVRVNYPDDVYGSTRDLRVDKIVIDGDSYESESSANINTGIWDGVNCGGIPYPGDEWLVCSGYIQYNLSPVYSPPNCVAESNSVFCSRLGKTCGSVIAEDNCLISRTVSSCGNCLSTQTCTNNVCVNNAVPPSQLNTFYISPSGIDVSSRNGSITAPWKSLSYACSRATASGSIIYVNAGTYIETSQCNLAPGVSIEGEGDNSLIKSRFKGGLSSSDDDALIMLSGGTNVGQHITKIKMDGELTGYRAITVSDRSNVDIYGNNFINFYREGIKFVDGTQTGNKFHDNIVYNCAGGIDDEWGVGADRGSDLYIDHNTGMLVYNNIINQQGRSGTGNGDGIGVGSQVYGLKIYNNSILAFQHSSPAHPNYCFAIEFWSSEHTSGWGTEIYGNTIVGELDIGAGGDSKGTYAYSYDIHDNIFGDGITYSYDEGYRTAIQFEIATRYAIVRSNVFRKGLTRAIYFCSQAEYNNDVRDTTIYNNTFEGITYGDAGHGGLGNAIDFGANHNPRIVRNITISNNTFKSNTDSKGECAIYLPTIVDCDDIYVKNNSFTDFTNAAMVAENQGGTLNNLVLNKNIYYNNGVNGLKTIGIVITNLADDGGIILNP